MAGLSTPIEYFVPRIIHSRAANKLIAEWRLEELAISNVVVAHFRSLGIFHCPNSHTTLYTDVIMFQLRNSSKLAKMVRNAKIEDETKTKKDMP